MASPVAAGFETSSLSSSADRCAFSALLGFLLLACHATAPSVEPYGDGLFVTTGMQYVEVELRARDFCRERGQPIMRPVDKMEHTVHVTGDPRIKQIRLIFRCEDRDAPRG